MTTRIVLLLLLVTFTGCTSDRYTLKHDRAPTVAIEPNQVPKVIPRAEPISIAGNKSPYTVDGQTYEVLPRAQGYVEEGVASWYGAKFHGHLTSNGEIFDMYRASAAHRTLPIPTFARVTNLANGREVVVRVNDRGPFHSERIIDLSYGAAVVLGFANQGTAPVRVEVIDLVGVEDHRARSPTEYRFLQLGAFSQESKALIRAEEVVMLVSAPVFISPVSVDGALLYRVRVGPFDSSQSLNESARILSNSGYTAIQKVR